MKGNVEVLADIQLSASNYDELSKELFYSILLEELIKALKAP